MIEGIYDCFQLELSSQLSKSVNSDKTVSDNARCKSIFLEKLWILMNVF